MATSGPLSHVLMGESQGEGSSAHEEKALTPTLSQEREKYAAPLAFFEESPYPRAGERSLLDITTQHEVQCCELNGLMWQSRGCPLHEKGSSPAHTVIHCCLPLPVQHAKCLPVSIRPQAACYMHHQLRWHMCLCPVSMAALW